MYDSTIRKTELYGPATNYVCMLDPRTAILVTFSGKIYRGESGLSFVKTHDPNEYKSKVFINNDIAEFFIDLPFATQATFEILDISGKRRIKTNRSIDKNST